MNYRDQSPEHSRMWREGVQIRDQLVPVRTYREVGAELRLSESQVTNIEIMALAKLSRGLRFACRVQDTRRTLGSRGGR